MTAMVLPFQHHEAEKNLDLMATDSKLCNMHI